KCYVTGSTLPLQRHYSVKSKYRNFTYNDLRGEFSLRLGYIIFAITSACDASVVNKGFSFSACAYISN
ncbi:unnamed protein product, partial [Porites evermanni]